MLKSEKSKDEKSSVRDSWIPISWRYNGVYVSKNKKKELPRKSKHKNLLNEF